MDEDVEVARRRAHRACLALARQADAGAAVHARRDFDFEHLFLVDPAFALAGPAGLFQHLAAAVAVVARAFDHEQALLRADLAVTAAQFAAALARAGLRARTSTGIAGCGNLDLDLRVLAVERFFQRHVHVVTQVCPAPSALAARSGTATEGAAENGFEDIAQVAEVGTTHAAGAAATHALLEGSMAVAIVCGAFLRVFQNLVGGTAGLEPAFGFGIARIAVRVILHRHLAIGGLDGRAVGIARHAQQFVEIDFSGRHSETLEPCRHRRSMRRWRMAFSSSAYDLFSSSTSVNSASTTSSSSEGLEASSPAAAASAAASAPAACSFS